LVSRAVVVRGVPALRMMPARIDSAVLVALGVSPGKSALRMVILVALWVAPAPKTSIRVGSAINSKIPQGDKVDSDYLITIPSIPLLAILARIVYFRYRIKLSETITRRELYK
jgi:hypothetical protein